MTSLLTRSAALARGFKIILSTPTTARALPPPLSGNPRKPFGFKTSVIHTWSKLSTHSIPVQAALSVEALGEYIGRLDDLIDQAHAPPLANKLPYRSNPVVRGHISNFVRGIKNDSGLTLEQRKRIFRLVGEFRRKSWRALEKHEGKELDLPTVLEMKEATSGEYGKLFSVILNIAAKVPVTQRAAIEEAFANMAMAVQVYDDLTDFHLDRKQRVPNIVDVVLCQYPAEQSKALRRLTLRPLWLRQNCPQTYRVVRSLLDYYISRIPGKSVPDEAFRAFPRVLWHLAQLRMGKPTS